MRQCIIFFIIAVLASTASSYTAQDQTSALVKLGSTWHVVGQRNDLNNTLIAYFNGAANSSGEAILQTTTKKTPGKSADSEVQQLFNDMKSSITQRGCTMMDLQEVTVAASPFKEWTTSFQCNMPPQNGSMLIVDADPVNLYTFTYNTKNGNLQTNTVMASKIMQNGIQICYKDNGCYAV